MNTPDNRTTVVIQASHQPWDTPSFVSVRAAWDVTSQGIEAEQTTHRLFPGTRCQILDETGISGILSFLHKPVGLGQITSPESKRNKVKVTTEDGVLICELYAGEMAILRRSGSLFAECDICTSLLQLTVLPG